VCQVSKPNRQSLSCIPCIGTIFRYAPLGNPNPTDLSLGRDILLLAGTVNLVGITVRMAKWSCYA
jgi:hypothetical protein